APGGYVLLTRGLYELLANDAEVAAVLGHEISHVVQRDHYNVINKQQVTQAGVRAAASQVSTGNLAEHYAKEYATKFGARALLAGLDRDAEFRPDQEAEVYLVRSGFNPLALYAVLQKMTAFGTESAGLAQLYRTHPPLDDRLDHLDRGRVPGLERYAGRSAGRPEQANRQRVAARRAVHRLDRGDDAANQPDHRHHRDREQQHDPGRQRQQQADAQGQDRGAEQRDADRARDQRVHEHAQVEVERFARVLRGERRVVALQQVDHAGTEHPGDAGQPARAQRQDQGRDVRGRGPGALAGSGRVHPTSPAAGSSDSGSRRHRWP